MNDVYVNPGPFEDAPIAWIERAVRLALESESTGDAELSVTLLDDEAMRVMNRDYLDRDYVTDVIAFALHEWGAPALGDVYVGFQQAGRQAEEHGVSEDEELARLAIHGTLHVLGHDHPEGEDRSASPMFVLQEKLLRRLLDAGD